MLQERHLYQIQRNLPTNIRRVTHIPQLEELFQHFRVQIVAVNITSLDSHRAQRSILHRVQRHDLTFIQVFATHLVKNFHNWGEGLN